MDYEKKYNEALKRAKAVMDVAANQDEAKGIATTIFPELRESENERIRKELVQFLTDVKNISESGRDSWHVRKEDAGMCDSFLSYLEKQKEPKHAPDELQKSFEEGQKSIVNNPEKYGLCKATEWSEEDERMARFYEDDYDHNLGNMPMCDVIENRIKFRDWILNRLKYLRPIKQEWSEEDEKFFITALWHISYSVSNGKSTDCHCDTTDWLKSIKERIKIKENDE